VSFGVCLLVSFRQSLPVLFKQGFGIGNLSTEALVEP